MRESLRQRTRRAHGPQLPRGRHGIPHELIVANQRERLLVATAEAIGECGYASLSVGGLIDRAGVSRATFYQLFDDKHHCVLETQEWASGRLLDRIRESARAARAAGAEWPVAVAEAIGAALDFTAEHQGEARLVLASSLSPSEPKLAEGPALHLRLVGLLRQAAARIPGARTASELTEEAAVAAAISIVGSSLAAGELGNRQDLRRDLVQIVLVPYLGGTQARRVAEAS
jgi:AcrR family transcriptional regulator